MAEHFDDTRRAMAPLNLGGEGEEPDCINQRPPWIDLCDTASRTGYPLRVLSSATIPFLFCDNTSLPFPDSIVDRVITNGVPVDQGVTFRGPSIPSSEVKRVLKSGGTWYDNGILVHTEP